MFTVAEYEKLLLGFILKNIDFKATKKIVLELRSQKFITSVHRLIYSAIEDLVWIDQIPDPPTVLLKLGTNAEVCGGIEYLQSLTQIPDRIGLSNGNLTLVVQKIDTSGTLDQIRKINTKLSSRFENFDKLVMEVEDPKDLLSDFALEVGKSISEKSRYTPLYELVEMELQKVKNNQVNLVEDIIPCGIPGLARYMIPRPKSFGCILGFPSTGKTSLSLQILLGVANNLRQSDQPGKVYFHSLDTPGERIPAMIAYMIARIDSIERAHGTWTQSQKFRYIQVLEWVKNLPIEVNDQLLTSDEMKALALYSNILAPRVLSVSDYAEKFIDSNKDSEERRMNKIIVNHRIVCRETGSCEILLSQPGPDAVKDPSKIAKLEDTRYSKSFEHELDWGLVIWNPMAMRARNIGYRLPQGRRDDQAVIFVQKNKGYPPTELPMEWIPQYSVFKDPSLPMNYFWDSEPWQFIEPEW